MDFGVKTFNFTPGKWEWDTEVNCLKYISDDVKVYQPTRKYTQNLMSVSDRSDKTFRDDIGRIDKLIFQKYFQRRFKLHERQFIILQDIKDVVLFAMNPLQLTVDFIEFVHTPTIDRLFRALIIYFQFYFQVWTKIKEHREEMKTKIVLPCVTEYEYNLRDDLADLRSMIAREYCNMALGAEDTYKFYHLANTCQISFIEKDRRLHELLIKMCVRIVWIALQKPNLFIIELEINRILRTDQIFKKLYASKTSNILNFFENEKDILRGRIYDPLCPKCSQCIRCVFCKRPPLLNELLVKDHDHRMLAIGIVDFPPSDERIRFLEAAYLLPEEELPEHGISVGILGMPREKFDCMLKFIYKKNKEANLETAPRFTFDIPPRVIHSDDTLPKFYPEKKPHITPANRSKIIRNQCRLWKNRIIKAHMQADSQTLDFTLSSASQSVLNLSNRY